MLLLYGARPGSPVTLLFAPEGDLKKNKKPESLSPHPSCRAPPGCRSAAGSKPSAPPASPSGTSAAPSSAAGGSRGNLRGHHQAHTVTTPLNARRR